MKITIGVESVDIDTRALRSDIENDRQFWLFAATQWYRLYQPYVPMQTGMLSQNVLIRPKEIEHIQPYAHRMYEGVNFRFRKDRHPKATAQWDKKAAPTQLPKLASTLQGYIDSWRFRFR